MNSKLSSALVLASLVGAVGFSGSCAAVAVGAGGAFMAQQASDRNAFTVRVPYGSNATWAVAKNTMSRMSLHPIDTDNDLRQAKMTYDAANVTVQVETFDVGQSTVRVTAYKFGISSGEIAQEVQRQIERGLDHAETARLARAE